MIDVHIICDERRPKGWVNAAANSIPNGICSTYIIPKGDRTIAQNRLKGFSKGSNPYISFVDDDDYAMPGAFEKCLEVLEANPELSAVGTLESRLVEDTLYHPNESDKERIQDFLKDTDVNWDGWRFMHHLVVLRRSHVEAHLSNLTGVYPEINLYRALYEAGMKTKLLMFTGYVWRHHNGNYHKR